MVVLSRLWTGAGQNRSNGVVKTWFCGMLNHPTFNTTCGLKRRIYKSCKGTFKEDENTNTRPKTLTNVQIRPMAVLSRLWTGTGQIDPAVWFKPGFMACQTIPLQNNQWS